MGCIITGGTTVFCFVFFVGTSFLNVSLFCLYLFNGFKLCFPSFCDFFLK